MRIPAKIMEKKIIKISDLQRSFDGSSSEIKADEDLRTIEIAFSSETPYDRGEYLEVLSHQKNDIDLTFIQSGRAPLLLDHDKTKQIGVIETVSIDKDGVGRATVRFSKSQLAEEVYQDVLDQIRMNISVGYVITGYEYNEKTGVAVCEWQPLEISIVSIPADQTVGVGRSIDINKEEISTDEIISVENTPLEKDISTDMINTNTTITKIEVKSIMSEENNNEKEKAKIYQSAARYGYLNEAEDFIANSRSAAEFNEFIIEQMSSSRANAINPIADQNAVSGTEMGFSKKESVSYETSLARAVRSLAEGRGIDGFVKEVNQELSSRFGKEANGRSIMLPVGELNKRTTQYISGTGTSQTVNGLSNTNYMGSELGRPWFADTGLVKAGAKVLEGAKGLIQIPVVKNPLTITAPGETGTFASSDITSTHISLTPTPIAGSSTVTNTMLYNSDPYIGSLIQDILTQQMAVTLDSACLNGLGNIVGVLQSTSLNAYAFAGDPDWAKLNAMEAVLASLNVPNSDNFKWLFSRAVEVFLKRVKKGQFAGNTDTTGDFVLDGKAKELAGYSYVTSNNVPSENILFGKFDEVYIAMYGAPELIVNPYVNQLLGETVISLRQDAGCGLRRPDALVNGTGVTLV